MYLTDLYLNKIHSMFLFKNLSIIKIVLCLILIVISIPSFCQFKPNQLSGLVLWLRADSNLTLNGSILSEWKDCSGNNNNALQTSSINQPSLINNNNIYLFPL